ncbi:MAG: alpha/beta fold hydrolase [Bacteroidales bacterium]|nr:alpha/beta fold hydrolase [Bacteroidales bacterium]
MNLSKHQIETYSIINNSNFLIVFETGLGDDHSVWISKNIPIQISSIADVLLYDRAGYGRSNTGPEPRDINELSSELDSILTGFSENKKLILVGHSLGGMIIRDYAVKNPAKVAALLFVDPSSEAYNNPTQSEEDMIFDTFYSAYGAKAGATMEARELIEDSQYMKTLTNLPNIPTTVLTSMKLDATHNSEDREAWYSAHELLKVGVSDFIQISCINSGHYIMLDEPNLIIDNLTSLISKLK